MNNFNSWTAHHYSFSSCLPFLGTLIDSAPVPITTAPVPFTSAPVPINTALPGIVTFEEDPSCGGFCSCAYY
jgi:hypothetical protein